MAKEAGTNVLLKISSGSPTSFVTLAGQQSTEFVGETETDDITDKANGGWGSTLTTLIRGTINVSGKADWPDTNALELIRAAWTARTTIEAQIVLNSSNSHYHGAMAVTQFNVNGTHTNATEYSITLQSAEAMTYAAT